MLHSFSVVSVALGVEPGEGDLDVVDGRVVAGHGDASALDLDLVLVERAGTPAGLQGGGTHRATVGRWRVAGFERRKGRGIASIVRDFAGQNEEIAKISLHDGAASPERFLSHYTRGRAGLRRCSAGRGIGFICFGCLHHSAR